MPGPPGTRPEQGRKPSRRLDGEESRSLGRKRAPRGPAEKRDGECGEGDRPTDRPSFELALRLPCPAAFLGPSALVLPQVQHLLGKEVNLGATAEAGGVIAGVCWAEQCWTTEAGVQPGPVVDWTVVAGTLGGLSKVQRRLSLALNDAHVARFRALRPVWNWMRLLNCTGPWASLWLSVHPAEHCTSHLDVE